jgi:hypothetical protein
MTTLPLGSPFAGSVHLSETVILVSARKLSALQRWLLYCALRKKLAAPAARPVVGLSFAEIKSIVRSCGSANAVNTTISRACQRLQRRGLVRVVHGPAITQAERYHLKKSKPRQVVAYRSWQAGIRLTDEGAR